MDTVSHEITSTQLLINHLGEMDRNHPLPEIAGFLPQHDHGFESTQAAQVILGDQDRLTEHLAPEGMDAAERQAFINNIVIGLLLSDIGKHGPDINPGSPLNQFVSKLYFHCEFTKKVDETISKLREDSLDTIPESIRHLLSNFHPNPNPNDGRPQCLQAPLELAMYAMGVHLSLSADCDSETKQKIIDYYTITNDEKSLLTAWGFNPVDTPTGQALTQIHLQAGQDYLENTAPDRSFDHALSFAHHFSQGWDTFPPSLRPQVIRTLYLKSEASKPQNQALLTQITVLEIIDKFLVYRVRKNKPLADASASARSLITQNLARKYSTLPHIKAVYDQVFDILQSPEDPTTSVFSQLDQAVESTLNRSPHKKRPDIIH